jgi:hypothetical protein
MMLSIALSSDPLSPLNKSFANEFKIFMKPSSSPPVPVPVPVPYDPAAPVCY